MRRISLALTVFALAAVLAFGVTRANSTGGATPLSVTPDTSEQQVAASSITSTPSGPIDTAQSTPESPDGPGTPAYYPGFRVSYLTLLDELHERMLSEGLALVDVRITSAGSASEEATVNLVVDKVVWVPSDSTYPALGERTASWQALPNRLTDLDLPVTGLAVIDAQGEFLGLAVPGLDVEDLRASTQVDPLFLTIAAQDLLESSFAPVPQQRCLPDRETPSSARDALIDYFTLLGDKSVRQRQASSAQLVDATDNLVNSNSFLIDPVTGWVLAPASQDVNDQLRSGVDTKDVVIRPAIPIGVTVPSVSVPTDAIAVFIAQPSNRVLGFTVLSPHFANDAAGNATPLFDLVLELAPPETGDDLAVYIRSAEDVIDCPATSNEVAIMSIPYDDYAGTGRATLNLGTRTYERVTAFRVPEV